MYIVVIFSKATDSAENPGQVRRHTTTTPICGLSDLADSHRRGGGVVVGARVVLKLRFVGTAIENRL